MPFLIHLLENIFILLTMLSSTYHFWGVHNLYEAKSAKLILESNVKLLFFLFSFFSFCFSFFVFRYSFFAFRFSLFDFVIRFFTFGFSLFVFRFFFGFLTFKIELSVIFDIPTDAEYSIYTFKILF